MSRGRRLWLERRLLRLLLCLLVGEEFSVGEDGDEVPGTGDHLAAQQDPASLFGLPGDLRTLISRIRRGHFKIELDLERLEQFGAQINRSVNRLTVGLITAALIVGTSVVLTLETGPMLFGLPALGLLGFLSASIVGFGLLWSIFRSGRG